MTQVLTTPSQGNILVSNTSITTTQLLDAYELTDRIYDDRDYY